MKTLGGLDHRRQMGAATHSRPWLLAFIRTLLLSAFWSPVAAAQSAAQSSALAVAAPHAYALVIGSNPGGQGQSPLKYAEDDAARVSEVLAELGRYPIQNVQVLLRPGPDDVLGALDALQAPLEAHQASGDQAVLFFYYSGHARANAMNLADEELPLTELRERLLSLLTTLTVAVLDACQSGAFSRAKGAAPTADFSFNSVSGLNTAGIAVMASSSASELSQESDELRASYFTHHLLVALRGGGDGNGDGRVSLDEAYRYAHDHTLADTARTAVGGQHPTLETELVGRGDVALTYPAEAKAQLELPKHLSGKVLIQKPAGGAVMAELYKAEGRSLLLAFPAGRYDVVLRGREPGQSRVRQCAIELSEDQVTPLRRDDCPELPTPDAQAKRTTTDRGAAAPLDDATSLDPASRPPEEHERWAVELSIGPSWIADDAYVERLEYFGFEESFTDMPVRWSILGLYQLDQYLGLAVELQLLDEAEYARELVGSTVDARRDTFGWNTYAVTLLARATLWLLDDWIGLYGQLGLGFGLGFATFEGTE